MRATRTKVVKIGVMLLAVLGLAGACGGPAADTGPSSATPTTPDNSADVASLVEEAYIYGLPLIMSYKTMYFYSVNENSPEFKAPFNQITNTARVYGPEDKAVVSPNSDTPYSLLWLDLRAEPVVLCVPEIETERYFSVMIQDLSTNLLPYIGSRTTGNDGGCYMVVGRNWAGGVPDGIADVIKAKTDFIFVVYRTQLFDADDLDNVVAVQQGYLAQTLSAFTGGAEPTVQTRPDFPTWDEKAATGTNFAAYLNFLLQYIEPSATEQALLDRLAEAGISPGRDFDYDGLDDETRRAYDRGVASALDKINAKVGEIELAGNTAEGYGDDWLLRAAVTQMGWGANAAAEASYPLYQTDANGATLDASSNNYRLTFLAGQQPPVNAFWSLTMYDAGTQGMIENPLNRYLLNSPMLPNMVIGNDGSLTLYIQKESPGGELEGNWLPAPDGPFYMLLRLYWPDESILDGDWTPPAVTAANQ